MYSVVSKAQEIVLREVEKLRGPKLIKGDNIAVLCPNPAHRDTSPSCNVYVGEPGRVPVGFFSCWSCGFKSYWNPVATRFSLELLSEQDNRFTKTRSVIPKEVKQSLLPESLSLATLSQALSCGLYLPLEDTDTWRTIPNKVLRLVGAVKTVDINTSEPCLLFPVQINDNLVGGIKAFYEPNPKIGSYQNLSGEWASTQGVAFYDHVKPLIEKTGYVVVVEGPRDALRLISIDIPAVAILGTKNISRKKVELIYRLAPRVVLCMDGDDAGTKAVNTWNTIRKTPAFDLVPYSKKYTKLMRKKTGDKEIVVEIDPCNAPISVVTKLKEFCGGK